MWDRVWYLWGLQGPPKAGPDSSAALGLGSRAPRHPLGPPAWLPMLWGEAPSRLCPQELWAGQAPGFLVLLLLWAPGWGPNARPGVWASLWGAPGHCRGRPPLPGCPHLHWPSWHASWRSGGPEKVVPASQRGRPRWKAPRGVWPGDLLFEGQCPPLCLLAALSAGARARQRPRTPGERCCRRLPVPAVALRGPRKSRRHTASVGIPRVIGVPLPLPEVFKRSEQVASPAPSGQVAPPAPSKPM